MADLARRSGWGRIATLASMGVCFAAISCAGPSSIDQSPDYIRKNDSAVLLDDGELRAARETFDRWRLEGHRPTRVELEGLLGMAHTEVKFAGELDLFWFGHSEIINAYLDDESISGHVQIVRQLQM